MQHAWIGRECQWDIGNPEGRRPLDRSGSRWMDNIEIDVGEIGYGVMDWVGQAQDRGR
jgi:hypothetical protein